MAAPKTKARPSPRARMRHFLESVEFPRGVVAAGVLVIGLILFLGAISDPDGNLREPEAGGWLVLATAVGLATGIVCLDRKRLREGTQRVLRSTWIILHRPKTPAMHQTAVSPSRRLN